MPCSNHLSYPAPSSGEGNLIPAGSTAHPRRAFALVPSQPANAHALPAPGDTSLLHAGAPTVGMAPTSLAELAPPIAPRASHDDTARALAAEYLDERKRQTREVAAQTARRTSRALTAFSVVACAVVWVLPAFVKPADLEPTAARTEASARMAVFLAAQRVIAYQRSTGHLPVDLAQAGADPAGLTYERTADSLFEIRAHAGSGKLAYRSSENPAAFLGNTFHVLGGSE